VQNILKDTRFAEHNTFIDEILNLNKCLHDFKGGVGERREMIVVVLGSFTNINEHRRRTV
jgi:hypothetical protein